MSNSEPAIDLRPGTLADGDAIVRLNSESVLATSPMDEAAFAELVELSCLLTVAERDGEVVGFLMGFADGKDLDGPNYQWFAQRLKSFLYIDRIVIDASCRGSGVGQRIYAQIDAWARKQSLLWLAAEMNLDPPNLASLRFHKRQGFKEIGTQRLSSDKLVSMQVKRLG
ncbi:MAG: GNAT family N-acetyltransferase [Gammaproteobacteria bacterium]|nr:GNAT family N-acetyltransferase [Gammaproteobacteria bacterium]